MANYNLGRLFNFNRFAKFFQKNDEEDQVRLAQVSKNSLGATQEEISLGSFLDYGGDNQHGQTVTNVGVNFESFFYNKIGRNQKYREMSLYPEISDALDMVCDDAIVDNPNGDICSLDIKEELPKHIEEQIREQWDYLAHDVFGVNERAWDMFRKWMIEGEIYIELITSDAGDKIIGIKILPSHTMMPVYDNNEIVAFMQTKKAAKTSDVTYAAQEEDSVMFDKSQIIYVNYGVTGETLVDVRGFLESAIRVYNQLKQIEDSLVIYRLVKSPMRRIFNVQTPGRMPANKAMEYLRNTVKEYRKKVIYNPETGLTDSAANIQTLTEDFWFIKNDNGEGTSVETMAENTGFLGEIDDVKYFLAKLNKALKIPKARWEDSSNAGFTSGKSGEISREEIKFAKFTQRLQRRFKFIFLDAFTTQLRMAGFNEQYTNINNFDIDFTQSNLFNEYRELDLISTKVGLLQTIDPYMYGPNNPTAPFAKEFVMKRMLQFQDAELQTNSQMLDAEKKGPTKTTATASTSAAPTAPETALGAPTTPPPAAGAPTAPPAAPVAPPAAPTPLEQLLTSPTAEGFTYDSPVLREWVDSMNK